MSRWILLALLLGACGVDGPPLSPDGRVAREVERNRNVSVSESAGFRVHSDALPPPSPASPRR